MAPFGRNVPVSSNVRNVPVVDLADVSAYTLAGGDLAGERGSAPRRTSRREGT